ncbi:hypothetical protein ACFV4N_43400 [Actinosynnema sp. NPDC059797]
MEVDPDLPGPARPATNTSVVVMGQPLVGKTPEEATDGLSGVQARLQGMDMDEPRELDVAGHPAGVARPRRATWASTSPRRRATGSCPAARRTSRSPSAAGRAPDVPGLIAAPSLGGDPIEEGAADTTG